MVRILSKLYPMLMRPGSDQSPSLVSRLTCFLLMARISLNTNTQYEDIVESLDLSLRMSMAFVILILLPEWSPAPLLELRNWAKSPR